MPNLKNGRPAPIFVGGSVLWETDYSQKPDPKSKQSMETNYASYAPEHARTL